VVYQRLGATTRRRLHQAIGEHLEQANVGRTADVASVLAAHFERSHDLDRGARYHGEAAARARARSAFREARSHLETALDLLRQQPETLDRLRREMACLQDLGEILFAIEGYGAESGARVFEHMRQLADRLDGDQTRLRAMEGELAVLTMRAEFTAARALAGEMLVLAEQLGDPTAIANTSVMRGAMLYSLGEAEAAHRVAERGMALFDPAAPPLPADIGILGEILLACASGYRGRVAQAQRHYRNALARAATLDTTFQRALATNFAAQVCSLIDDGPRARALADETVRLATENGFSFLGLTGRMVRAACDVEDGRVAQGLADVQTAFEEYRATGQRYNTTYYSALLVRAQLAAGAVADARRVVDDALAFAAETGERLYEAELLRLKAECLLAGVVTRETKADAARHLEQAIADAAERNGLLFEVRATVSLCRLQKSARARVTQLVARFAPEDECADLRRAREVLDSRHAVTRPS
jgi:tetratricopeptide (TPR) repeat protein